MEYQENPLAKRLIDHFGGRPEAAKAMGRTAESMRLWLMNGIPLAQAVDVEQKSAGIVTADEILDEARALASKPTEARPA